MILHLSIHRISVLPLFYTLNKALFTTLLYYIHQESNVRSPPLPNTHIIHVTRKPLFSWLLLLLEILISSLDLDTEWCWSPVFINIISQLVRLLSLYEVIRLVRMWTDQMWKIHTRFFHVRIISSTFGNKTNLFNSSY